jgi:hypothetical protein
MKHEGWMPYFCNASGMKNTLFPKCNIYSITCRHIVLLLHISNTYVCSIYIAVWNCVDYIIVLIAFPIIFPLEYIVSCRHGVKQRLNCWADGVPMITQYPILPNQNFTYRFDVSGQEGMLISPACAQLCTVPLSSGQDMDQACIHLPSPTERSLSL